MSPDPYIHHLLDQDMPCAAKEPVNGRLVCTLHARAEQRGLELVAFPSRAVLAHEVHELILTNEAAAPNGRVDRIAYLGFFEVENSGILWVGDEVCIGGRLVGTLAGYDMAHFPNHMNIVIHTDEELKTGYESGFAPGTPLSFTFPRPRPFQEQA